MNEINPTTMLPIGAMLNGRYRVERHLASGGFGNTYAAINEFGERVAVKEFFMRGVNHRDEGSTSVSVSNSENRGQFQQQREKFKKEAMRLRGLLSPHIVKVLSFFEENGTAYYVMDYIDGESLAQRMERLGGQAMPEAEVRAILDQVLDALDEVHHSAPPLYHLDIKPGNIMVDRSGMARLIDFGASKQYDASTGGAAATTEAAYTKGYAPLEQVEGRLDKVGPWTDFYALGATLYRLLTAQKPPQYSDIQDDGPAAFHFPATVSEDMRDLILWMMKPQRSQRPQTIAALRQQLQTTQTTTATTTEPQPAPSRQSESNDDDTIVQGDGDDNGSNDASGNDEQGGYVEQPGVGTSENKDYTAAIITAIVSAAVVIILFFSKCDGSSTDSYIDEIDTTVAFTDSTAVYSSIKAGSFTGHAGGEWEDGWYYGDWKDGKPEGKGEFFAEKSRYYYKGSYHHGKKSGYGVEFLNDNSGMLRYEGNFENGKRSGRGTAYFNDKTTVTATWRDNKPIESTIEEGSW